MLDYKPEDLILLGNTATGAYSGNTEIQCILILKSTYSQLDEEDLGTIYYDDLDGKHSEEEGQWFKEDFKGTDKQVAMCLGNECDKILDHLDHEVYSELVVQLYDEYEQILEDFELETTVKVFWRGEQL